MCTAGHYCPLGTKASKIPKWKAGTYRSKTLGIKQ